MLYSNMSAVVLNAQVQQMQTGVKPFDKFCFSQDSGGKLTRSQ